MTTTTVTADKLALALSAMNEARTLLEPDRLFSYPNPPQWDTDQIGRLLARLEISCIHLSVALSTMQLKVEA